MLKNIKQFVDTIIATLFCKHEYEPNNWIVPGLCPFDAEEPRNWHHIYTGSSKMFYYKCKHCGKEVQAELMSNKLDKILKQVKDA